ncbi:MAG: anti-sigma factor family protein [Hyphomicrobiales bacterium]
MTDGNGHTGNGSSDATLLAYLHDQLDGAETDAVRDALAADAGLRQRADELQRGGDGIAQAFAVMLEDAPDARLRALLDATVASAAAPPPYLSPPQTSWSWGMRLLAAAVVVLVAFGGGVSSSFLFAPAPAPAPPPKMASGAVQLRDAVSHYMALYSKTTLSLMPSDPMMLARGLTMASDTLDLDLSRQRVDLPSADFKGARILTFKDNPLIQIGYLHGGETPLALCITRAQEPAHGLRTETRWRQTIAYWSDDRYVYVVLGKLPEETVKDIAQTFAMRFR